MSSFSVTFLMMVCLHMTNCELPPGTKFKMVYDNDILRAEILDLSIYSGHSDEFKHSFFYNMEMSLRIEYCMAAINFAGLDLLQPLTNVTVHVIMRYDKAVLNCKTTPHAVLHKDEDGTFSVITFDTEFYTYNYDVKTVKSAPMPYSESQKLKQISTSMSLADYISLIRSSRVPESTRPEVVPQEMSLADFAHFVIATQSGDEPGRKNHLLNLKQTHYSFLLCWAAKKHVREQNYPHVPKVPSLLSTDSKRAELLDFGNELGIHVSIPCPTTPPMYVYCKHSAVNEKDVRIVIVQDT